MDNKLENWEKVSENEEQIVYCRRAKDETMRDHFVGISKDLLLFILQEHQDLYTKGLQSGIKAGIKIK